MAVARYCPSERKEILEAMAIPLLPLRRFGRLAAGCVTAALLVCALGTARAQTSITSLTVSPSPFYADEGQTATVTATGTAGVANLAIRVTKSDRSTVVRSSLALTESPSGTYTTTWNGKDDSNNYVRPGTYSLRVYNLATSSYIGDWAGVDVASHKPNFLSCTVSPSDYLPNGTDGNPVLIHVSATPLSSGNYRWGIYNNWLGWMVYNEPMPEPTSPGEYDLSWNGVSRWSWNGYMGNSYYGYGEDHSYTQMRVVVWAPDGTQLESPAGAYFKTRGVWALDRSKYQFEPRSGDFTTFTASGAAGLNLELRVTRNSGGALSATLPMTWMGNGTYTCQWNGSNSEGVVQPTGDYTARVYNTDSGIPYQPSQSVNLQYTVNSIGVVPAEFYPNGTGQGADQQATITVTAAAGQTGLKYGIHNNWLGWMVYQEALPESSTPGQYTVNWNGVGRYSYNGYIGNTYSGYGENHSYNTCTVYVWDANGQQSLVIGTFKVRGIDRLERDKDSFAAGKDTVTFTARGYSGFHAVLKITRNSDSQVVRSAAMTGNGDGTYTFAWDGMDGNGTPVAPGDYSARVYNSDSDLPYQPSVGVRVTFSVVSITAVPDPFSPDGTDSQQVAVSIVASPGQAMKYGIYNNWLGWMVYREDLPESSTPGVYNVTWNGVSRYSYSGYMGSTYSLYGEDHDYNRCIVYVWDASNVQSLVTGSFRVHGICQLNRDVSSFNPRKSQSVVFTAKGYSGFNVQLKVFRNGDNTPVRVADMADQGDGSYTFTWDGKTDADAVVDPGTFYVYIYNKDSGRQYVPTSSVSVNFDVDSFTVDKDPFVPTGLSTDVVKFTVTSAPGQRMQYYVSHDWLGSMVNWTDMTETTPGTYEGTWDGVSHWSYNGYIPSYKNYKGHVYARNSSGIQAESSLTFGVEGAYGITASPTPFTPGGTNTVTISATAYPGLQLDSWIYNNATNVITRKIQLTEASGTYSGEWDGKDQNGNFAGAGTYRAWVVARASEKSYYYSKDIQVKPAVFSISASPDPFAPTGDNNATLTLRADAGQAGLYARISHPAGMSQDVPLTETGSEGTYIATWNGRFGSDISPDGVCTITVFASNNVQFPTTGTITVASVSSLSLTPNPFEPGEGKMLTISAGVSGTSLALEARIGAKAVPLASDGAGHYTGAWDGQITTGQYVAAGQHTVNLYNSTSGQRYTISATLTVVDQTPPKVFITGGPAEGAAVMPPVNFIWTGADNLTRPENLIYSTKVDDGDWTTYDGTTSRALSLADGNHTFSLRAKDQAGNVTSPVLMRSFIVDSRPPGGINVLVANDSANPAPIQGATVTVKGGPDNVNKTGTTDSQGHRQFDSLRPGDFTVSVSAAGYLAAGASVTVTSGQVSQVQVKLTPAVSVVKSLSPDAVLPGDAVSFTLVVKNNDTVSSISDIAVSDTLAAGLTPVADSAGPAGDNPVIDGQKVSWSIGSLAAGSEETLTFQAVTDAQLPDGQQLSNSASAVLAGITYNSNTVSVTVRRPMLALQKSADDATPASGQVLTYTIAYTNSTAFEARHPVLQDGIPGNTSYVVGSTRLNGAPVADPQNGPAIAAGVDLGVVPGGASGAVQFSVRVAAVPNGTSIGNTAYVSGGNLAGSANSNTVQVVTQTLDTAAPDTVISSGPGANATVCGGSVTFTFTGSDDTTHPSQLQYAWRMDGGAWSAYASATSQTVTALTQGQHTFEVAARDASGKVDATPASRTFSVDVEPAVIDSVVSVPSQGQATITWVTDKPSTSQVEYGTESTYGMLSSMNGSQQVSHSVSLTGLSPSTLYHFRVRSTDGCGREVMSSDFTFTTGADDGSPETQITAGPSENGTSCSASVQICWTGSDSVSPASQLVYAWKMDTAAWSEYGSDTCHQFTSLAEGTHTFSVRAKDPSGNVDATPATRTFTVDLSSPVIENVSAAPQAAQFVVTWTTNKPTTSQVEYGTSSSLGQQTALNGSLVKTHSVLVTGLTPDSTYYYRVRSKDGCERETASTVQTVKTTPDSDFPGTQITSPTPSEGGKACSDAVQLCWIGSDNATPVDQLQYSWQLDDGAWSAFGLETCHQFTGLAEGSHVVRVKAKDGSGNVDATPAVRNFRVDLTPPTVSNVAFSARQSSATISWISSEPTTSQVEYGLTPDYGSQTPLDGNMVTSHKLTVSGLTPATTYHFRVRSGDSCNDAVSPDRVFTTAVVLPANLVPQALDSPAAASSEQQIVLTWTVKNQASGDAAADYKDTFYLSTDDVLDENDKKVVEFTTTGGLAAPFSYTRTESVKMPIVAPGLYTLFLKTDSTNLVSESNENDNVLGQLINVTLQKRLSVAPDRLQIALNPLSPVTGQFDISNLDTTALTGLSVAVADKSPNVTVQVTVPDSIPPLSTRKGSYTITASDESVINTAPTVTISSAEGASASMLFDLLVIPRQPKVVANPGSLEFGMLRGKRTMVECEITNTGGVPATELQVLLPAQATWMSLVSPQSIGTLAPGEKAKITLALNPPTTLPLGPYNGSIVVNGKNGGVNVGFMFRAVSDGKGDLKVFSNDEFTYFADGNPRVANATVTLKDAVDGSTIFQSQTDGSGSLLREAIPEGNYNLEVSAERHGTYRGPVEIVAGQVQEVKAFLPRQLVTYTWTVEPVQIEDKYKVNIEATFETHVPAPVVTVDPPFSLVPVLEGKTTEVDFTITNHGMIAAQGVSMDFPVDPRFEVVPLVRDIGILAPQSSIVVPVLIRARKDGPIPDLPSAATGTAAAQAAAVKEASILKTDGVKLAEDPSWDKPCDLTIEGKVLHYYVCDGNRWRQESVDLTLLYIAKEVWDIVSCGFDLAACASTAVDGVGAAKCPDAVRCLFKYTCEIISAGLGTPCCFCKMTSALLGDTGEMGDAAKCLPTPALPTAPPSNVPTGWGIGIGGGWGGGIPYVSGWSISQGGGSCGGAPKPASASAASTSDQASGKTAAVSQADKEWQDYEAEVRKYGGRIMRHRIRGY